MARSEAAVSETRARLGRGPLPLLTLLTIVACGGSPDAPTPKQPVLRLVAGQVASDTIDATLTQGIVAQVIGPKGQPESGVAVTFGQVPGTCVAPCSLVLLSGGAAGGFMYEASDTTAADGKAVARTRLGLVAGVARVLVTVPIYGLADTARFTIQPGAATSLVPAPRDTAVELGRDFQLRARVLDRAQNARTDPVAYEASNGNALVDSSGRVSGKAVGRTFVRLRVQSGSRTLTDSAGVLTVPVGQLALVGIFGPVSLANLAGGQRRVLDQGSSAGVDWAPTGDRVVYTGSGGLVVTDTAGKSTTIPVAAFRDLGFPRYSSDGQWIYFQGQPISATYSSNFRVRADGTGLTSLGGGRPGYTPAPSPDGRRVAYLGYQDLWMLDLASDSAWQVLHHGLPQTLSWSPDGQWIVVSDYVGGFIVHPDGTGFKSLPNLTDRVAIWSPDSRWIIGSDQIGTLYLIDPQTAASYTLPVGGRYAAWRK